jgi:hypothetical protein
LAQKVEKATRKHEERNMSGITPSDLKTSVSARAAITITALITWGFSAYIGYIHAANPSPTVQTEQVEFDTATSGRNSHNG